MFTEIQSESGGQNGLLLGVTPEAEEKDHRNSVNIV